MKAVITDAAYILAHTPDMVISDGSAYRLEKIRNPKSEILDKYPKFLRKYEDAVNYLPNQVFIGNRKNNELSMYDLPWYKNSDEGKRYGRFGEIMPENEFFFLLKIVDEFDLIKLSKDFIDKYIDDFKKNPVITEEDIEKVQTGAESDEYIQKSIKTEKSVPLYYESEIVGCVKRGHDLDENLRAGLILENYACKATGVLAVRHLIKNSNINPTRVDYVIECSENACGDMEQRGGGSFSIGVAESSGLKEATGIDMRGFCAGPVHSLIVAAALVESGVYRNIVVVAGGSVPKLGLNSKNEIENNVPILEDVIGGFAMLVTRDDGVSPFINLNGVGRYLVGMEYSPIMVMKSLVLEPLKRMSRKITDVDKYAAELQNLDITMLAGSGDIPMANYKLIANFAVEREEIPENEIDTFCENRGVIGFAPTQGHIPSGIAYIGEAINEMKGNAISSLMVIGRGSLLLARMTNRFDGVSFLMERNNGEEYKDEIKIVDEGLIRKIAADAMREVAEEMLK